MKPIDQPVVVPEKVIEEVKPDENPAKKTKP